MTKMTIFGTLKSFEERRRGPIGPRCLEMSGVTFGLERRNEKRRDEKEAARVILDWVDDMRVYIELPDVQRVLKERDACYEMGYCDD